MVGDTGVGKTGLGWRPAHGEFKEHASTHGQQFWPLTLLLLAVLAVAPGVPVILTAILALATLPPGERLNDACSSSW